MVAPRLHKTLYLMKALLPLALLASASMASAVIIGVEDFSYPDGNIAGQNGGTGFNYDNFDGEVTSTPSDWDNVGGAPTVSGGKLVTNSSSAQREYNGDIDDTGNPGGAANDGQDDHPRSGAIRGTGQVFYSFEITRSAGATWSGASSYDFGAERVFFGVPGTANPGSGNLEFGVQIAGTATHYYTGIAADTNTHTIVTVLDFDNQQIGLWVDPDGTDFFNAGDGTNSADAMGTYTATNWSSAVRFGSGGSVEWDDLVVGTTFVDVIPEPSIALLGGLSGLLLLRRRR